MNEGGSDGGDLPPQGRASLASYLRNATLEGLGFLIGFRRSAGSRTERLGLVFQHLPAQLGGLTLVALGAAAVAVGFMEWLDPAGFRTGFQSIFGNPWPFADGG